MHYGSWVVNHTDPDGQVPIDPPRAAVVRSELYDGTTRTLAVMAVSRAPGWVCVCQTVGDGRVWHAWVPADRVRPT